jgi:hypothetical protein
MHCDATGKYCASIAGEKLCAPLFRTHYRPSQR